MSPAAGMPVVALLTDFGLADPYVGMMKAAILEICPGTAILDLSHDLEPQGVGQGAFLLGASLPHLPEDAVMLAVQAGSRRLVGPDNGLLSRAWESVDPGERAAYELDRAEFWRPSVSDTFHGRDLFAPVAAHLAHGLDIDQLGSPLAEIELLGDLAPEPGNDGELRLRVEHIDRFGNLITNLAAGDVPEGGERWRFRVGASTAVGIRSDYAQPDALIAVVGGLGYLELAAPGGSAKALTGASIGDAVIMSSNGE